MTGLFDTNDVFAALTREQAKVGDKGYFGNNLRELNYSVIRGEVHSLVKVTDADCTIFPFVHERQGNGFALFLPVDKVKNKEPTYRPFANLDELLEFLVPDVDVNAVCDSSGNNDEIIRYKKAELLLGKKITIREKQGAYTNVVIIQSVDFYGDSDAGEDIRINNNPLNFMFEAYKILIDGEFVPFGVKE